MTMKSSPIKKGADSLERAKSFSDGALGGLEKSEQRYRILFENIMNGCALHKIITDKSNNPVDYIFLEINSAFEKLTGLNKKDILGRKVTEVLPGIEEDPADWIKQYGKVALQGQEIRFERYSQQLKKWFSVLAFSPEKESFATIFEDITVRKESEQKILKSEEKYRQLFNSLRPEFPEKYNDEIEISI